VGWEPAGTQRQLAAIAGEDIQPDRRQRQDEHRDEYLGVEILIRHQRHAEEGNRDDDPDEPAILRDREDRLVGRVGGLVLPDFAVEHGLPPLTVASWPGSSPPSRSGWHDIAPLSGMRGSTLAIAVAIARPRMTS